MGQTIIVAGALGVAAYGALKLKTDQMRSEPRHAPGNLEKEHHARRSDAPAPTRESQEVASQGHTASDSSTEAAHLSPPVAEEQYQTNLATRSTGQSSCEQIAEEVRLVREHVHTQRKQRELAHRARMVQEGNGNLQQLREQERRNYPCPTWLTTRGCINVAVTGNAGVGKSSFINTIRGLRARDQGAADVSPNETTMRPTAYDVVGDPQLEVEVRLWDLPGAGTKQFPREVYIQTMGLRYFDVVIILTASRYTETEIMIAEELCHFEVPSFMVRNKVDADISNNEDDHGLSQEETLSSLRAALQQQGIQMPYLVSSKFSHMDAFDMLQLKADVFKAMCEVREVERHRLPSVPPDGRLSSVSCRPEVNVCAVPTTEPAPAAAG
mmetsp:Transcript_9305/g.16784  ORF Transcript_9305/g.16784 Transcript_9305/m.16784 type:complete len:383 (-) Transcript_9305:89-1237(-)